MLMTAMLYTFFALFFVIFHKYIPLLFLDGADLMNAEMNNEVIALAGKLLLIAAIFQISDGLQVTILGSLRGLQDVNIPMIGCFISYWIIGFPVALVLGLQTSLGAQGIWYGLLAGLTASAIFSYLRFNYLTQKLIKTSSDLATI
jgi:MATE family multidrug resistance protein